MSQGTCSLPECLRPHLARGLCNKHYYAAGHGFSPKPCRSPGCDRLTGAKTGGGLCEMHYARLRRTGTLADGKYFKPWLTAIEVIHDRAEPHEDCVIWTGSASVDGYGTISWAEDGLRIRTSVHRLSWTHAFGPIPPELEIDHVCHTLDESCRGACRHRRCVNPEHMELVTHPENVRRIRSGIAV